MLWNISYYHLKWRKMLYLTIFWCFGSTNILWLQSVLGLTVRGPKPKSDISSPKCAQRGGRVTGLGLSLGYPALQYSYRTLTLNSFIWKHFQFSSFCRISEQTLCCTTSGLEALYSHKALQQKKRQNASGVVFRQLECIYQSAICVCRDLEVGPEALH